MGQTTGGMSAAGMYVGYSANGSSWTEFSGSTWSVEVSGGERVTGAGYTFDGDTPIVKAGKRQPLTVTVRGIFSGDADELYQTAQTYYENGSALYLRWSPGGGDAGDLGFTTNGGYVKNPPYPGGDATSGDPVMSELVLECATITESTIGTAGW